jgi:hypothetical protein
VNTNRSVWERTAGEIDPRLQKASLNEQVRMS